MKNLYLSGSGEDENIAFTGIQKQSGMICMGDIMLTLFHEWKADNIAYIGTYRFVEAKGQTEFDNKTWYHAFRSGVFVHFVDVKRRKQYLCKCRYYEDDPWDLCFEKMDLKLPILCRL